MPAISVIVPVYNVEPYLHRCVESILQQTFTDFELILVDDGSPDNCPAICDQYAAQDKRVHVIHQKNGGLSAARNAGIDWAFAHSDSEWITFIDSDDWVHERYLEKLYKAADLCQVDLCACEFQIIKEGDDLPSNKESVPQKISVKSFYSLEQTKIHTISSCVKMYRKKQWENIRFPFDRIHEDRFTTHKLIFQNEYIGVVYEKLYYYYLSGQSILRSAWTPKRLDDLQAVKEQFEFFEKRKLYEAWKKTAVSHLGVLCGMLKDISKSSPYYETYHPILKKQLRKALREYRKKMDLPMTKYGYIYDMAYPFWMRQYWRVQKILKLLHLK